MPERRLVSEGFGSLPAPRGAGRGAQVSVGGVRALPAPALGMVRLRAVLQPELGVELELAGDLFATGYGGYAPVARRQQVSIGAYEGREPTGISLRVIADRWSEQRSVEEELARVETMCGTGDGRPPQLIMEGRGIPYSFTREPTWRWVVKDDPAWNERRARRDGVVCLFDLTLNLMRLVRPDSDALTEATTRQVHVVRTASELRTLRRIARHYRTTWSRLRQLNPGLAADPDRRLKAKTKVRVS